MQSVREVFEFVAECAEFAERFRVACCARSHDAERDSRRCFGRTVEVEKRFRFVIEGIAVVGVCEGCLVVPDEGFFRSPEACALLTE